MSGSNVNAIPAARSKVHVKTVVSLGMLTAVAYVVMYLSKLLPQVSGFLQLDMQATVISIGGFISCCQSSRCSPSATPAPSAAS